jgi:hypothetical protein
VQAVEVARRVDRSGADYIGRRVRDPGGFIIEVERIVVGLAYTENGEETDRRVGDIKSELLREFVGDDGTDAQCVNRTPLETFDGARRDGRESREVVAAWNYAI